MAEKRGFSWKKAQNFLFPPIENSPSVMNKPSTHDQDAKPAEQEKKELPRKDEGGEPKSEDEHQIAAAEVDEVPELKIEGFPTSNTALLIEVRDEDSSPDEWELLSGKHSNESFTKNGIFVTKAGSVRSINSIDNISAELSGSVPFKIHRTLSSSTIDSENGDRTLGLKGVDYVEHIVLPSDTLQGLCLAYKISATRLRQANHFSGSNLSGAPKKLIIPLTKSAMRTGFIRVQDTETREYKLHALLAELPELKETEAEGYLELAEWNLEEATMSAREDGEWDQAVAEADDKKKTGDIRIKVRTLGGIAIGFEAKGAGLSPPRLSKKIAQQNAAKKKVEIYDGVPAIATKTVRPQDVYDAAPQHDGYGVELKPISK